ncbi:MAG: DUF1048 domain-containing protein [Oscillospiraceae bacterium]
MSFLEKIFGENYKQDKKAYKEYKQHVENLPEEYQIVMKAVQKYIWTAGSMDGSLDTIYKIIELFEEGVVDGKKVLDITGSDVAAFAKNMAETSSGKTYEGTVASKINANVEKQFKK